MDLSGLRKSAHWYIDVMKRGIFTEREIIALRGRLNSSSKLPDDEKNILWDAFYELMPEGGYKITSEQSKKGIDYLKNNTWKKNGDLRKNNIFGTRELEILEDFKEFRFIDLYNDSPNFYVNNVPVYSVIDKEGYSFDYTGVCYSMIRIVG